MKKFNLVEVAPKNIAYCTLMANSLGVSLDLEDGSYSAILTKIDVLDEDPVSVISMYVDGATSFERGDGVMAVSCSFRMHYSDKSFIPSEGLAAEFYPLLAEWIYKLVVLDALDKTVPLGSLGDVSRYTVSVHPSADVSGVLKTSLALIDKDVLSKTLQALGHSVSCVREF